MTFDKQTQDLGTDFLNWSDSQCGVDLEPNPTLKIDANGAATSAEQETTQDVRRYRKVI